MQVSALVSLGFYAVAFTLYQLTPERTFTNPASVTLWVFIVLSMLGVIAGNVRSIALMTLVTVLIPEDRRDKANGLVGTTLGISFLVTSVISGLLVAAGGMFYVLLLGMGVVGLSVGHLAFVRIPDRPEPTASADAEISEPQAAQKKVDIRGTLRVVRGVPGLLALIAFACFNNFLGGAFMALMDAYGLYMMSVQAWGLLWGALSTGFIIGGLAVAKTSLGKNPVRLLLLVNIVFWSVTCCSLAGFSDLADCGYGHLHAFDPVRRSVRTDHPPEGSSLRAAGQGFRVRPERRDGCVAANSIPDRADHAAESSSRS